MSMGHPDEDSSIPITGYYVLITGIGEGCDYTIGCNMRFQKLKATNMLDARKECIELLKYHGDISEDDGSPRPEKDRRIKSIQLLTVLAEEEIDIFGTLAAAQKVSDEKERNDAEMRERQLFERLKKKYG